MEDLIIAKLLKQGDRSFTATEVRLIGPEGEQLNVVSTGRAREMAREAGLDLVLVSDKTNPPVVRIMNFGKLQYEQKKNLKTQKKNNTAQKLKEVKFHVTIDTHDYEFKIKRALEFMEKGCRLKVTLTLRGREMAHQDLAFDLMKKVMAELSVYGDADGTPKMLGRNISVVFAPKKADAERRERLASADAAE